MLRKFVFVALGFIFTSAMLFAQTINVKSSKWSLLGATQNVTTMTAFDSQCVKTVWYYDDAINEWKVYLPGQTQTTQYKTLTKLDTGNGFWVLGKQNCAVDLGGQTPPSTPSGTTNLAGYTLIAWNDLGMHCVDGNDYSIFSILPPYNNLHAQLLHSTSASNPTHITNATVTFESTVDLNGNTNSTVNGKTNFWDYLNSLFPGLANWATMIANKLGLGGLNSPSATPQRLIYDATSGLWKAEGIPIMPYDDNGIKNFYPMVKVVARDASGNILASTKVVLPVSDEMDCKSCHLSNSSADARPTTGWVNDALEQKDWKRNILKLHDQNHPTAVSANSSTLSAKGYTYDAAGLLATADGGKPILCAACHQSNALGTPLVAGIKPLTQALHSKHAAVIDPVTKQSLGSTANRDACYRCHPGSATQCLRGAMGSAKNADGTMQMQCQSCHGTMAQVGASNRQGWLDQPDCGHCHTATVSGGQIARFTSAFSGQSLRAILDTTFASPQTATTKLYRQSKGHGGVSCEACHGSTHAEYPSTHAADNVQSIALQGHSGTIGECNVCHTTVPNTPNGGPHGLHTVGQAFVDSHGHTVESSGAASCTKCHGADYRGTALSRTMTSRTFTTEHGTKTYAAKQVVGCYDCHNGPIGD